MQTCIVNYTAKDITDTLKTITKVPKGAKISKLNIFCRCHRKKIEANKVCPKALKLLPKCGGKYHRVGRLYVKVGMARILP